jgi:hypothetical protein
MPLLSTQLLGPGPGIPVADDRASMMVSQYQSPRAATIARARTMRLNASI